MTISRAVETKKWAVMIDHGDPEVIMTSWQLEKESATVGTCEAYEDDINTDVYVRVDTEMEDGPAEAPVEAPVVAAVPQQKEPFAVGGAIWTCDPELEIAVDSSKPADMYRPLGHVHNPPLRVSALPLRTMDLGVGFWKFFLAHQQKSSQNRTQG